MRRHILLLTMTLALCGCATLQSQKSPVCDGKHRRPANTYGSVLDPVVPTPSTPSTPAKLSAAPLAGHGSCGA